MTEGEWAAAFVFAMAALLIRLALSARGDRDDPTP
jgi:hypothetical protein